jgi:signal recognition particle GTPase
MAAKTLTEALLKVDIKWEIKKALCLGVSHELTNRIEEAERIIVDKLKSELRDYFAHEVMRMYGDEDATSKKLFDVAFKNISAFKNED